MIGTTISHYTIFEKLGEGGMGVVYKAHDTNLDRTVALKFLPSELALDPKSKERFVREAKAASSLQHHNICTIHDVDQTADGQLFIVMDLYEGETLKSRIAKGKSRPERLPADKSKIGQAGSRGMRIEEATDIATQVALGLAEAHEHGITHRDIKPANILITKSGVAKIVDFGLAKLSGASKLTRTSSTVGTVAYMSPEQLQNSDVDARSDIFSFGVVLYEMLTGKTPFRGDHEGAVMYSIMNEEPEPLQMHVPEASSELIHVVSRALEKDPANRYQTMDDLLIDLRRVRKETSKVSMPAKPTGSSQSYSAAEPSSVLQQQAGGSFLSRYKLWIGGAAVVVIAAAILAVFILPRGKSIVEINPAMTTRVLEISLTDIRYHGLSGDGNWATFPAKDAGGNWHVYLINTRSGEPKTITTDSMFFMDEADISLDGSRVVFDGIIRGSNRNDIFLTSALGGGSSIIAQGGDSPRWQPDAKRIFFLRGLRTGPSASKKLEIWSVTPEGTEERLEFIDSISVSGRFSLSVSPDGKAIVWLRTFPEGHYQEVVVRDLVSGAERQLTFNKKPCDDVCWASNNQIIFSSNKSGNTNLWMVPAGGGEQVQITNGLGPDLSVKISTDLKKLLYYENHIVGDFWIGSLESGVTRQITFDERRKFNPTLSPDGKLIAYEMYDADPLSLSNAIDLSGRDGSDRRKLATSAGMFLYNPIWSPDGSRICYVAQNSALHRDSSVAKKAYVIDVVRTGASKLVADGIPIRWFNEDSLLLLNGGKTLMASLATGQVNQFFEDSTFASPVPGGKSVAYYDLHKSDGHLWIVEVDASFRRKGTARRLDNRKDGFKLFMGSSWMDYQILKNAAGKLLKVWVATGKEDLLPVTFPNLDNAERFSLNPGTNEFVYQKFRSKGKLVMIENLLK